MIPVHLLCRGEDSKKSVISVLRQKGRLCCNQVKGEVDNKQNIPWRDLVNVKVWRWKRTQYFLGTASVGIKGHRGKWWKSRTKQNKTKQPGCKKGLYSRRVGGASERPHGGQPWPDLYFRRINHSGRNWQEASVEQGARRLRVKWEIEQQ